MATFNVGPLEVATLELFQLLETLQRAVDAAVEGPMKEAARAALARAQRLYGGMN